MYYKFEHLDQPTAFLTAVFVSRNHQKLPQKDIECSHFALVSFRSQYECAAQNKRCRNQFQVWHKYFWQRIKVNGEFIWKSHHMFLCTKNLQCVQHFKYLSKSREKVTYRECFILPSSYQRHITENFWKFRHGFKKKKIKAKPTNYYYRSSDIKKNVGHNVLILFKNCLKNFMP